MRTARKAPRWAWVRSTTQRPGTKPRCFGASGLARVARNAGREAERGDAGAEGPVVEGAVGREHARWGVRGHVQLGERVPGRRQVVAVAAGDGQAQHEPAPVDDGRPLRALLAPVEP